MLFLCTPLHIATLLSIPLKEIYIYIYMGYEIMVWERLPFDVWYIVYVLRTILNVCVYGGGGGGV